MSKEKYAIGIDLGTTNIVLSYKDLENDDEHIKLVDIPQLVDASNIEEHKSLPSFLYLLGPNESGKTNFSLPWSKKMDYAVGRYARTKSAETPMQTVSAAKSWLCRNEVDRHNNILPWNAPEENKKVSPVEATKRYLNHLVELWNNKFKDHPIKDQIVVLTVPASFDAAARELTREAAVDAGLPKELVLLEEPQAALYAWLSAADDKWRDKLSVDDTILVYDVGGGTSDFSLIQVNEEDGNLILERIAVGNHILVGGDNMDLTLAHLAKKEFAKKNIDLDAWQSVSLWHACRDAKEKLFSEDAPEKCPVTILGRGSKLIGGTITIDFNRKEIVKILKDGFFPETELNDVPSKSPVSGFKEIGLPFESDVAVTKHLAAFLTNQQNNIQPTHILFNGGVFKSDVFKEQVMTIFKKWYPEKIPQLLDGLHELDYAVAKGAAYYGSIKTGKGIRIRGGTGRSYYIGIETAGLAVPGMDRPLNALCVVPFGMEEGTETDVTGKEIGLVIGKEVQFRFFSSSIRKDDVPGNILNSINKDDLEETDPLNITLPASGKQDENIIPVKFHSKITELGIFELWCYSTKTNDKWKLEFSVREEYV